MFLYEFDLLRKKTQHFYKHRNESQKQKFSVTLEWKTFFTNILHQAHYDLVLPPIQLLYKIQGKTMCTDALSHGTLKTKQPWKDVYIYDTKLRCGVWHSKECHKIEIPITPSIHSFRLCCHKGCDWAPWTWRQQLSHTPLTTWKSIWHHTIKLWHIARLHSLPNAVNITFTENTTNIPTIMKENFFGMADTWLIHV
jgi:hypothetical protein